MYKSRQHCNHFANLNISRERNGGRRIGNMRSSFLLVNKLPAPNTPSIREMGRFPQGDVQYPLSGIRPPGIGFCAAALQGFNMTAHAK